MKKSLIGGLVLTACFHAVGAANRNYTYLGVDAMGSAKNVDRSVFIGSAAGYGSGYWPDGMDWGYNIINDVFIGGASGLQTFDINSSVGIGYHSLRTATSCSNVVAIGTKPFSTAKNCVNCVGIGADVFFGANGATNEVNINNQLFISPTNFWVRSTTDDTGFYNGFNARVWGDSVGVRVNGTVWSMGFYGAYGDVVLEDMGSYYVDGYGETLYSMRNLIRHVVEMRSRIETLETTISHMNLMSAPNPNTQTNTPASH